MTDADSAPERRVALGHPALGRVLALEPSRFAQDHWDRTPLLSSTTEPTADGVETWTEPAPDRFTDLFSLSGADELLSTRGLRTPFLRLAKDGAVIPPARFTAAGGVGANIADQVDSAAVARLFADGATVVFQGLHRTWPPLVAFTAELIADLGHPIQVNGYLTPPTAQGFAAHYDTHDVFVLQVAGRKHWTIHPPVIDRPWPEEPSDRSRDQVVARAAESPYLEADLGPGDALYLPRGWLHSARAGDEPTLHLTFGVHPVTVRDVLRAALDDAVRDERARAALPLGLDAADAATYGSADKAAAQVLADLSIEGGLVQRAVADRMRRDTRPEPVRPVGQAGLAAAVSASTRLRLRRGLAATQQQTDGTTYLVLRDRRISLPGNVRTAWVTALLVGTPIRASDLVGDEEAALDLVRLLVREAVLVPAE